MPQSTTLITHTTTNASSTQTSSAFLGITTVVSGEAVINGTQTMTNFVFLSMTRNLQTGTQSVAAPTSLPPNVGAQNCNQKGGLICMWWWGSVGWGLCLSCTPGGINPKIGRGTTITIHRPPKPPSISPPRCLWCPLPPPGTDVQTVEGVEDEPPVDQPTVDSDGEPVTTASRSLTSSASSVATSFAIYPNSADDTAINNAFNSSLYELADPSTIYASVDEDMGDLFWLADLNYAQVQTLSDYGVSLSNWSLKNPANLLSLTSKI